MPPGLRRARVEVNDTHASPRRPRCFAPDFSVGGIQSLLIVDRRCDKCSPSFPSLVIGSVLRELAASKAMCRRSMSSGGRRMGPPSFSDRVAATSAAADSEGREEISSFSGKIGRRPAAVASPRLYMGALFRHLEAPRCQCYWYQIPVHLRIVPPPTPLLVSP